MKKRELKLDRENKMISGVCSGIANYFNLDSTVVRLIWMIVTISTMFMFGVFIYILLATFLKD